MELHSDRDHREHVDLLVIGWGKGGKTLAGAEGRAGKRVALIEQDEQIVGGTCINVACVPTIPADLIVGGLDLHAPFRHGGPQRGPRRAGSVSNHQLSPT